MTDFATEFEHHFSLALKDIREREAASKKRLTAAGIKLPASITTEWLGATCYEVIRKRPGRLDLIDALALLQHLLDDLKAMRPGVH